MPLDHHPHAAALRGHSTNLVGIPTGLLASAAFNEHPVPLHISGVRETNSHLFAWLSQSKDARESAVIFQEYMKVLFDHETSGMGAKGNRRRYRSNYLRLLKGWGYDSNSPEGAVLKGWVESRFGLIPTFHKESITRFSSPEWIRYLEEKMSTRFHNNSINLQLDLLYEYCQWTLARHAVGRRHVTLYRGTNSFEENQLIRHIDRHHTIVRLNNLVSFTSNRIIADEFGDFILEAEIPTAKILFFNELLNRPLLKGEAEYLVIGGDYHVRVSYL